MKLLLHICCAPCSIMCIKKLREDKIDVDGYFYNPNIHPYMEYRARKDTLRNYSNLIGLKVIYNDVYGLDNFVKNVGIRTNHFRHRNRHRFAFGTGHINPQLGLCR